MNSINFKETIMDKDNLIKKLCALAQLDIDAVGAYEKALPHIAEADIKMNLNKFKIDHHQHIQDLSIHIKNLGGEPPKQTPDFSGVLIKIFTTLLSITGTQGALKAMKGNEELTNKAYKDALEEEGVPEYIHTLLIKNKADEAAHLRYIESVITD
jgi:hypothetical protein